MNFNRIFGSRYISDNAVYRMHEKAAKEMDKYLKISQPWEVSEKAAVFANQLFEMKEVIQNFARHNKIHVDMFIPKEKDILNITVSKIDKKGKPIKSSEVVSQALELGNESYEMQKRTTVMLEDKDGLNYLAKSVWSDDHGFVRKVFRIIDNLTKMVIN